MRTSFQAATAEEFVAAVEQNLDRKVRAFPSGVDPDSNVVFANFYFDPRTADGVEPPPGRSEVGCRDRPDAEGRPGVGPGIGWPVRNVPHRA